jgi:hypothetical protein
MLGCPGKPFRKAPNDSARFAFVSLPWTRLALEITFATSWLAVKRSEDRVHFRGAQACYERCGLGPADHRLVEFLARCFAEPWQGQR